MRLVTACCRSRASRGAANRTRRQRLAHLRGLVVADRATSAATVGDMGVLSAYSFEHAQRMNEP